MEYGIVQVVRHTRELVIGIHGMVRKEVSELQVGWRVCQPRPGLPLSLLVPLLCQFFCVTSGVEAGRNSRGFGPLGSVLFI